MNVSGDGDFYCLIEYLLTQDKLGLLMVKNHKKYSFFLKHKKLQPFTRFVNEFKNKLEKKKRQVVYRANMPNMTERVVAPDSPTLCCTNT